MKTSTKVLYWTARILCILAILFISLFALDSVSSERTFWQNTTALLMSLIPSFVLLAVLIIAWKWEKTGGIILTIIGLALCIFIFVLNYKRNHFPVAISLRNALMLAIPFVLAGILFILSHYRKKKELSGVQSQTPPQS
jgi:prolipoprotein diacylglyceryltransferase